MMKKYNLDWKVFAYTLLWAVLLRVGKGVVIREAMADVIYLVTGIIFWLIGIIVAVMERRMGFNFFYAWGKNWKGSAISNSSLIAGAGIGFMPLKMMYFICAYLVTCILITLIKNVVKVNEEHVNAEKHYPIR